MILAAIWAWSASSTPLLVLEVSVLLPLALYAAWRLWTFTVQPMLNPKQPRELPYNIPYIAHGQEYLDNAQDLIDRTRRYLGNTREPFAVSVGGGTKLYYLTDAADVASFFKNMTSLDFGSIVKPLITSFGLSQAGCDLAFRVPPSAEEDPVRNALALGGDKRKPLMLYLSEFGHAQLLPSGNGRYHELESAVMRSLQYSLSSNVHPYYLLSSPNTPDGYATVSLFKWTFLTLSTAIPEALFGPKLARDNVALLDAFHVFSKYNWKLWYGWKDTDDVQRAKTQYVGELKKWLALSHEERDPETSWLWCMCEKACNAAGMSQDDIGERAGLLFWVSNSNPSRLTFWVLNFLLFRPEIFARVKTELEVAMPTADSPISLQKLADESPYLNAAIEETLRLTIEGAAVRIVKDKDGLEIGGKTIPFGARLLAPPRQLHMNESVWGDAKTFQPERWLSKKSSETRRNANYMPFGGGITYCPGRFLAKSSIRIFLAIALARYDVQLEPGQVEAHMKLDEPVQGPVYPVEGMDLKIMLRKKV